MGKGYAEGPAVEAAEEAREAAPVRGAIAHAPRRAGLDAASSRSAHFLGWADEVDADELFRSGQAWGIRIVEVADEG